MTEVFIQKTEKLNVTNHTYHNLCFTTLSLKMAKFNIWHLGNVYKLFQ